MREEWRHSRQGKKVLDGRCGQPDEAKPVPGQTCPIETAPGELLSNAVEGTSEGAPKHRCHETSRASIDRNLSDARSPCATEQHRRTAHPVARSGSTLISPDRIGGSCRASSHPAPDHPLSACPPYRSHRASKVRVCRSWSAPWPDDAAEMQGIDADGLPIDGHRRLVAAPACFSPDPRVLGELLKQAGQLRPHRLRQIADPLGSGQAKQRIARFGPGGPF